VERAAGYGTLCRSASISALSVPGPITADAVFLNKEEVSVVPIYRDPIHDFGFFRFDPNELKWVQASTAVSSHMCTASSSFEGFCCCSPTLRSIP
jgi:hypothetical protein